MLPQTFNRHQQKVTNSTAYCPEIAEYTFPLCFDCWLDTESQCYISTYSRWPILSDLWLSNLKTMMQSQLVNYTYMTRLIYLHDSKCCDGLKVPEEEHDHTLHTSTQIMHLSHSSPSREARRSIFHRPITRYHIQYLTMNTTLQFNLPGFHPANDIFDIFLDLI